MIAELGLAALWLAAALAGLQLLGGVLGLRENGAGLATLVRPAAVVRPRRPPSRPRSWPTACT